MRIAVIGSGISGLVAAYQIAPEAEVTVFEANDYVGGHTHTIDVSTETGHYAVDTGFIVFNDWTYPNFCKLMDKLGVESQKSDMSFGICSDPSNIEFALPSLNSFFANRSNLFNPKYYSLLRDVIRFNKQAKEYVKFGLPFVTLGEFFKQHSYSESFLNWYVIPMIAAIWSADPKSVADLPAQYFLNFFNHHGLLNVFERPQWRVIKGGSSQYIEPLSRKFSSGIRLNSPIESIQRLGHGVAVKALGEKAEEFDHVVIAAHSNQALAMLSDASDKEKEILGSIRYMANDVVLHTDENILPKSRRAWASWNYRIHEGESSQAQLTYHMNRLQGLKSSEDFCVSMNQTQHIDSECVLGQFEYSHPAYDGAAILAQKRHGEISGVNRTHFCGAYWGYGFHEDGVNSALAAMSYFGKGEINA